MTSAPRLAGTGIIWRDPRSAALFVLGLMLAGISLYASSYGTIEEYHHRGGMLCLAGLALLLGYPLSQAGKSARRARNAIDLLLAAALLFSIFRFLEVTDELWSGLFVFGTLDIVAALAGLAAIIELTRRAIGLPLALLALLALLYCLAGSHLPWIFRHPGYSPEETILALWYSLDGVFGLAAAVMVSLIYIYVIFGAVLDGTGAGVTLIKFATTMTGRFRGGPAHGAIMASALFGSISGSAAANVVGTGVFTIPAMKQRGFKPAFAGAVEAAASTGGQITPPVMGAAAFVMSQLIGVSYLTICVAAIIPALFYYGTLFHAVTLEAKRLGMVAVPTAERPKLTRQDALLSLAFLLPILAIVAVMASGRSAALAGFWAIVTAIVTAFAVSPDLRRHPGRLIKAMAEGGTGGARIMVAVAAIGIMIGTINMTGIGLRFSSMVLAAGDGSLFPSLVLTAVACLGLGMGLPTLPAYLIMVLVMGPALEQMGVPLLIAHLFVLYYGVLSAVTPPVAIAAYAAAPIAQARPLETGLHTIRLSIAGFFIPFVFVYNPSLVLVSGFEWGDFTWGMLRLAGGIWLLNTAASGIERCPLQAWQRLSRLALGLAALAPFPAAQVAALAAGALLITLHYLGADRRRPA